MSRKLKIYQSRKVKKYKSNCDHILPKTKTEKFDKKKLYSVNFYSEMKDDGSYIKRADGLLSFMKHRNTHKNFLSHFSLNRNMRQFKYSFNSNLDIIGFFMEVKKDILDQLSDIDAKNI